LLWVDFLFREGLPGIFQQAEDVQAGRVIQCLQRFAHIDTHCRHLITVDFDGAMVRHDRLINKLAPPGRLGPGAPGCVGYSA
jgi:hypothetical protein